MRLLGERGHREAGSAVPMTRPLRWLPLLALALAMPASADPGFMEWPTLQGANGKRPVFSFTAPAAGAYATLTASTGQTITCTRAGTAAYQTSATALATAAANTCRVDYRGLLVEESRTNVAPYSQDLTQTTTWRANNGSIGSLFAAPDGTNTARQYIPNTSNAFHDIYDTVTTSAGAYTASYFTYYSGIKYNRNRYFWGGSAWAVVDSQNCTKGTSNSGVTSWSATSVGSWCRITTTLVFGASAGAEIDITPQLDDTGGSAWAGDGASGLGIWGAQLEAGTFATSYIPTTTTAVTRPPDVVDVGAVTLPATYSLSATANPEGLAGTETSLYLTDGTHTRALSVDASGHAVCSYDATADATTATLTAGTATKIACKYDGAKIYACLSGTCTAGTAAASDGATAMTHLYVGSNGSANFANSYLPALCAGQSGACRP